MKTETQQKTSGLLLPVFIIGLICSLIIFTAEKYTRVRIEKNRQLTTIRMLETVMPLSHDNDILADKLAVPALSTNVYRARRGKQNIGLVFMPILASGYNGRIKLAVGLAWNGTLSGVRILEQHETEGLGDNIDQHKSDWIFGFQNRSLANTANTDWAVRSDGGNFDQLSGATISPRGVINAVRHTLEYYAKNRQHLYR